MYSLLERQRKFEKALETVENTKGVFMLDKSNDGYHHFSFMYRGYRVYVERNSGCIDEKRPGDLIFDLFRILPDGCTQTQITYFNNFEDLSSVDDIIDNKKYVCEGECDIIPLHLSKVNKRTAEIIRNVVSKDGGEREKNVLVGNFFCTIGDTWNDEHMVVDVFRSYPEEDGYFDGFSVDVLNRRICA
ncbi:hypothetical protein bpr_II218 (plasmid) [Butyrivibrio proteoclasticus B316]|uniref:Uncharacterized protein n=1 Tax=Butyrivibrio proteoclasticus (strain ATCC 51982 / DSM 14932 / B316) TaxID=515622 RepID=E0S424_BUTPB|nr:hypothetical protein [Butyrivibrio proteoclasticus]ADL36156.1 hypothetical protein bpr_II218 [Butyrivibrio proteoclasticus B316]